MAFATSLHPKPLGPLLYLFGRNAGAQVLDASFGLFETCDGDTYLPAAAASMALLTASGGTVDVFEVVGRLLVKCLIDGHSVPPVLAPSLYTFLLGAEVRVRTSDLAGC